MIKKIESIKNLGIFNNYKSDNSLNEFKKFNLIYGWNASGKTTLSKLFESLKNGKNENFPNLKYRISISNPDRKITEDNPYDKSIKVFNKEYVSKNVEIEKCEANSLIILGEENQKLSSQIKKDRADLKTLKITFDSSEKDKKDLEDQIGRKFTWIAKTIGEAIGGSARRNYIKTNAKNDFDNLVRLEKIQNALLEDTELNIYSNTCKQESIEKIEKLFISQIKIDEEPKELCEAFDIYKEKSKSLCLKKIDAISIERFQENTDILKWVEEGLSLHKKHKSEVCEFCSQQVPEVRLNELRSFFNKADRQLKKEIDSVLENFGEIHSCIQNLNFPDKACLYKELQENYQKSKEIFKTKKDDLLKKIQSLKDALKSKKEKVSQEVILDVSFNVSDFTSAFQKTNQYLEKHNRKTSSFQEEKKAAEKKVKDHHLASIYDCVKKKEESLERYKEQIENINKGKNGEIGIEKLQKNIEDNEAKISSKHKACKEINNKLKIFLGRDEISFEVSENKKSYLLKRKNASAKNLSEGEKTAIALIYFLVSLKEKGHQLSETIIFIDDPISSFDSNSISQAFAFIKKEIEGCLQIFISTHNYYFFKKTKNWLHNKRDRETESNEKAEFFMIKNPTNGEIRQAKIEPLDKLIMDYSSEYQYLFSILNKISLDPDDVGIEEWYPIPNIARKFLETFLAFKVPSKGSFSEQLTEFFNKTNLTEQTKKEKIQDFLNEKSHAFPNGVEGFDLDNFSQCKPVIKDIISLVKKLDEDHYKELCKLI